MVAITVAPIAPIAANAANATMPTRREDRNMTMPEMPEIPELDELEMNSNANATNLTRIERLEAMNYTVDLNTPVFYTPFIYNNGKFFGDLFVPPEFFIEPKKGQFYLLLKNKADQYLSCDVKGTIGFNKDKIDPKNLFIIEHLVDNVIAIRSLTGGYLYFHDGKYNCKNKLIQFFNRFEANVNAGNATMNENDIINRNNATDMMNRNMTDSDMDMQDIMLSLRNLNGEDFIASPELSDNKNIYFYPSDYGQSDLHEEEDNDDSA